MIRPDQIPDAVVEAAVTAFDASEEDAYVSHAHDIRIIIAAALNAWPDAITVRDALIAHERLILPLPAGADHD